jgi:hypothetical protein
MLTAAAQVQDGAVPVSNFDASAMSALFPTPLLDMRGLNARACNSSVSENDRIQALEVGVARYRLFFSLVTLTRLLLQLLEELVQKRDNARGLSRLDSFECLKHVRCRCRYIAHMTKLISHPTSCWWPTAHC